MTDFFLVSVIHSVFQFDASEFTRPMTNVETPYEIDGQFNYIAYGKGTKLKNAKRNVKEITFSAESVLRMFMYAFGENTFMDGVTNYLISKYTFDNI